MIWSIVTGTPRNWKTRTGWGASPGTCTIVWLPKARTASGGIVTDRPRVHTILIIGEARRSSLNKTR